MKPSQAELDTFTVRKSGRKVRFINGYGVYCLPKRLLADLQAAA